MVLFCGRHQSRLLLTYPAGGTELRRQNKCKSITISIAIRVAAMILREMARCHHCRYNRPVLLLTLIHVWFAGEACMVNAGLPRGRLHPASQ